MRIKMYQVVILLIVGLITFSLGFCTMKKDMPLIDTITSVQQVVHLFPKNPQEISTRTDRYMMQAQKALDAIIAIPHDQRTFINTAKALDDVCGASDLAIGGNMIEVMEHVHPDAAMRQAAHDAALRMQAFWIDQVSNNKKLYEAFKAYVAGNKNKEHLTPEQEYFIEETMKGFRRAGLDLPDTELEQLRTLKKDIAKLCLEFSQNIAVDNTTIVVPQSGLAGLDEDFIASLKKTDDGQYILGVDYPTYFNVIENCAVEDTRKKLAIAFNNRAYPVNAELLKQIITKRDELAKKLGYNSYADYDLDEQMVKSVNRAQQFMDDLLTKSQQKVDQELAQLKRDLPESVTLAADGTIKPWDFSYMQNQYKKKHLAVDERALSEYFPMQKTVDGLFDIYKQFFGIDFKKVPHTQIWHEDVELIEVYSKDGHELLGYIFLDLYPRPNKFSHAAQWGLSPALQRDGKKIPAVVLVVANFPKPTGDKPALLKRSDVNTFFHEFGHALHTVFGRTELASQAGTNVKNDFVELPSQMLEEWLWDRDMLKKVSGHYKTGAPLPDDMIDNILALKTFDSGNFLQRQLVLSKQALHYYMPGADKDPYQIMKDLHDAYRPQFTWMPENHFYASWGHLTGYAAKYYGYMWSKVFALDIFEEIKKHGLLNPEIGQKYINTVIGKGGSADPNELLRNFLGREPNNKAFLKDLGLMQ